MIYPKDEEPLSRRSRRSEEIANARNEDCALRAQNEELALLVDKK